jgi:hypothetical protein
MGGHANRDADSEPPPNDYVDGIVGDFSPHVQRDFCRWQGNSKPFVGGYMLTNQGFCEMSAPEFIHRRKPACFSDTKIRICRQAHTSSSAESRPNETRFILTNFPVWKRVFYCYQPY